jgi:hypothetical protein
MKIIKRITFSVLAIILLSFIFRGVIFRSMVDYRTIGQRKSFAVRNEELKSFIGKYTTVQVDADIRDIIDQALAATSDQLQFSDTNTENDPNMLVHSKTAHCVGYAAFFTTCCNALLVEKGIDKDWIVKHQIGQLYLFGNNVHRYFNTPFFKDHDFVTVESTSNGEVIAVDPSVDDCFGIDRVSYIEE